MFEEGIEFSFASEISESDYSVILKSKIFTDWLEHSKCNFKIQKVHFQSVDFLDKIHQPLFIKFKVSSTLADGKPVHRVVLVRGHAVGVLVVLLCEGEKYLLLVNQPRLAISEKSSLEIPAGILDWSGDFKKVALEELREEAQIEVLENELIDLTEFWWQSSTVGFAGSCGLLDERIRLYAVEREVSCEELRNLDGKNQIYTDESEWIKTVVLPYEEAAHQFIDGKNLIALFLYERYLKSKNRF